MAEEGTITGTDERRENGVAVRIFAPATVGNLGCGFDVLGLALEAPGDTVEARRRDEPGVVIEAIEGDGGRLPRDPARNTAALGASAALRVAGVSPSTGLAISLRKGLPLAAGMGGSGASAVAGAVAADRLLGLGLDRRQLLRCASEAEYVGSGSTALDNVAPSLFGGICLALAPTGAEADPHPSPLPTVVELPVPPGVAVALAQPQLETDTRSARAALGDRIRLEDAVVQWGNLAGFVAALFRGDMELLRRTGVDRIAEPIRSAVVPGFRQVREAALGSGALAASLSGSGPAVFALASSRDAAEAAGRAMVDAFAEAGIEARLHLSSVGHQGAREVP
jgi:homoserine kinase